MPTPYHVRLAISQYGENFRAELFTEDLGDTEGDLLTELPPSIAEWVPYLSQGADLPPDAARQLGKDLFAALLGQPENAKKWAEVLTQAARKDQPIRLLIDATTEAVRDLPYGLLCEPHDDWFLFRGGKKHSVEFVRILRRCSPRPLKLNTRLRVLIAVAEPKSADVPPFDATLRLQKLAAAIYKEIDLVVCGPDGPKPLVEITSNPETADPAVFAPYVKTTRDALRRALTGDFDVFHLLAHGHGAGVLLCTPDGTPAETSASELGEWCGAGQTSLAFLQVCKAGQTAGRGGFGGVAQQLLNPRGGNLAAVVASTFPLDAEHSTHAAVGFYRQLAAGKPPEEALTAERPESDWCWAFLELWARPGAIGGGTQRAAFQFVSPYRGLSSFGEQDADLFFGRKSEVAELMQILRAEPAVAVVGDSGSGKTSLLHAGLVHAIRRDGLAGSDKWKIVSLRPGYRPVQSLLTAMDGTKGEESMASNPQTLRHAVKSLLQATNQPLMIVFDQFEEVFTLARDKTEVQILTDELVEAVEWQRDRFRLVLGMRSEFLGQAASVPGLSRLIRRPWVLRPPSGGDMRDIVGGPAEHCGYTFQGPFADGNPVHAVGLLDRILADPLLARDQGGLTAAPLPLLQFALERLWLKAVEKGATEFTHAVFDEIGGMGKAIAQHAEAVYIATGTATEFGSQGRLVAEQIITALVSPKGLRQPRVRDDLQAETGNPEAARAVVDYLVGERLLTVRTDPEDMAKSLVDLSHEALILNWDRLRGWLAEDPQGRAMREEFRKAAEQWESGFAGVQPKSWYGLPGADVARNYLAWIDTSKPRLGPIQMEFAQAMRDMLTRLRRRRQIVMSTLGALTVASCMLALYADVQKGKARDSANDAIKSAKEAQDSEVKANASAAQARAEKRDAQINSATLALEKGIQICEEGRPRLGILAIAYSLQICPKDAIDLREVIRTNLAAWGPHLLCLDEVHALPGLIAATDPAGKYALVVLPKGKDEIIHKLQLYNIDTEKPFGKSIPVFWKDHKGKLSVSDLARASVFPNKVVLITGAGHSAVWDMTTGTPIGKEIKHGSSLAALSPDGKLVAATDGSGNVRLYDVMTGMPRDDVVYQHQGKVHDLAFSFDGKLLASGCGRRSGEKTDEKEEKLLPGEKPPEGFVHLYEISVPGAGRKPRLKRRMSGVVTCVKFSPDNKILIGGGFELKAWWIADKDDPKTAPPDGALQATRFSPESTVHLVFDPKDRSEVIACNPSGGLQILRKDESIRQTGETLSPQGWVAGTGFREDGRIFTANRDGTVRIWLRKRYDQSSLVQGREFKPPNADAILSLAFHPKGESFALGSKTGIVFLYDRNGSLLKKFHCVYNAKFDARRPVTGIKFSTDGNRIIAHDEALNTFVFDIAGDEKQIEGTGKLIGVAADGKTAVVQLKPGEYQISEVGSKAVPTTPKMIVPGDIATPGDAAGDGQLLRVSRVAFSPDRSVVALLDKTSAVHLFRTATGESLCTPLNHTEFEYDGISAVTFSPVGDTLLTRSQKSCGIWDARTGARIQMISNPIGIQVARFSPHGKFILGGTNFDMAQVWDLTGRKVTPIPLMHSAQIWGLSASPDGTRIITASFDRTARIWDLSTGRPASPPLLHKEGVSDAIFSPDGTLALTGSWDGTARLWKVPQPVPNDEEWITTWVETMTGLKVGLNVSGEMLTATEWLKSKKELFDRWGGPPPGTTTH